MEVLGSSAIPGTAWKGSSFAGTLSPCQRGTWIYHCSEYLYKDTTAQYGKGTIQDLEWVQVTLVRLTLNQETQVIAGLKRMKAVSTDATKLIEKAIVHLSRHSERLKCAAARRGEASILEAVPSRERAKWSVTDASRGQELGGIPLMPTIYSSFAAKNTTGLTTGSWIYILSVGSGEGKIRICRVQWRHRKKQRMRPSGLSRMELI